MAPVMWNPIEKKKQQSAALVFSMGNNKFNLKINKIKIIVINILKKKKKKI
jgi:hypothetical protein